jgi:simple sugar transport system permease protein
LLLPLALILGTFAGALWSFLPSLLRERRGVHEVITCLLLNYIAQNVTHFLVSGPLKDPAGQAPQTPEVRAFLPRLLPAFDVHYGLPLALCVTVMIVFTLYRTVWGYETRVVGLGREAGETQGIPSSRTRSDAFLLSGALCGLAGGILVLGEVPFRRFAADFYGIGYGFDGLAVALLVAGAGFPSSLRAALSIVPSALLFGALSAGAEAMAFDTSTPKQIIEVVQAILIVAIAGQATLPRFFRRKT